MTEYIPIRLANHSSSTSFGFHKSLGKLVTRSSTSTNSTNLVYRCGLRNERFAMRESLKCLGFVGSFFSAWNCASLACDSNRATFATKLSGGMAEIPSYLDVSVAHSGGIRWDSPIFEAWYWWRPKTIPYPGQLIMVICSGLYCGCVTGFRRRFSVGIAVSSSSSGI